MRCWLAPRNISPGASWGAAIVKGIAGSRLMMVVVSAESQNSQQVAREVERGVARQMNLIPLRLEDQPLSDALEYFLSQSQWLNAFPGPIEEHFGRIAHAVTNCLRDAEPREHAGGAREGSDDVPAAKSGRLHPDEWGRKRRGGFFNRLGALFDDR